MTDRSRTHEGRVGRLATLFTFVVVCAISTPAFAGEATVPDVVGLSLEDAKGLLEKAGFTATIEPVHGPTIGVVFSQTPGGLSTRDTSTPVALKVGVPTPKPGVGPRPGPGPTTQPGGDPGGKKPGNGLGTPPAGAGENTKDPEPTAEPRERPPVETGDPGRPSAGLMLDGNPIPRGALPRTNGPELPSVLGQARGQAQRALRGWRINVEQTLAVRDLVGKVLNQWPYAGTTLARSETVTVVVGVAQAPGPGHSGVPQAQGNGWHDAVRSVRDAGFKAAPVSVKSGEGDRGKVVAQSPLPGSLAARGAAVRLYVGRGPGAYGTGSAEPVKRPETGPTKEPPQPGPGDDTPPAGVPPSPMDSDPAEPKPGPVVEKPPVVEPPAKGPTTEEPPMKKPPVEEPPVKKPPVEEPPKVVIKLASPSLKTPPAGESYPYKYGADFTWTQIPGAKNYELELQEELPSGAWQSISTEVVTGTKHRPAKIARGRYRWRVRAMAGETEGLWSEFRRLYMY